MWEGWVWQAASASLHSTLSCSWDQFETEWDRQSHSCFHDLWSHSLSSLVKGHGSGCNHYLSLKTFVDNLLREKCCHIWVLIGCLDSLCDMPLVYSCLECLYREDYLVVHYTCRPASCHLSGVWKHVLEAIGTLVFYCCKGDHVDQLCIFQHASKLSIRLVSFFEEREIGCVSKQVWV